MFSLKAKKKDEPQVIVQPVQQQPQPIQQSTEQSLLQVLENIRQIHEGACLITMLVTDNEIKILHTEKAKL